MCGQHFWRGHGDATVTPTARPPGQRVLVEDVSWLEFAAIIEQSDFSSASSDRGYRAIYGDEPDTWYRTGLACVSTLGS